jgi:hypothetical protein
LHRSVKKPYNKKTASYGRIEETTIGGIFIPGKYRHIRQYKKINGLRHSVSFCHQRFVA